MGVRFIRLCLVLISILASLWVSAATQKNPAPAFTPDKVVSDGKIVYFLSKANHQIYRWSMSTNSYLIPLTVGINDGNNVIDPSTIEVHPTQRRLYLGYPTGDVRYISTGSDVIEKPFVKLTNEILNINAAGKYLAIAETYSLGSRYFNLKIYSSTAALLSSSWGDGVPEDMNWNSSTSILALALRDWSYIKVQQKYIDQTNGRISDRMYDGYIHPYSQDADDKARISSTLNGKYYILNVGSVFNAERVQDIGKIGGGTELRRSLSFLQIQDGSWITAEQVANTTKLQRRDSNDKILEEKNYTGKFIGLYASTTKYFVFTQVDGVVTPNLYTPSRDSDSDGVTNDIDAFPIDASASIDSDSDGFPDSWNTGASATKSTTGLVLDAAPRDWYCTSSSQLKSGKCDYKTASYLSDLEKVTSDGSVIYSFSRESDRSIVYRWSIAKSAYISPLKLGYTIFGIKQYPQVMDLTPDGGSLFLGYRSGRISYIPLTAQFTEVALYQGNHSIQNVVAAGNLVLSETQYYGERVILNSSGTVLNTSIKPNLINFFWDNTKSRLIFNDSLNSFKLGFLQLDQSTGKETLKQADLGTYHRLSSVSAGGKYSVFNSGLILNNDAATTSGVLPYSFDKSLMHPDGSIVSLQYSYYGNTILKRANSKYKKTEEVLYSGTPIGIFGTSSKMTVVLLDDGQQIYKTYIPNNDLDGDGVANDQDAFPTDTAASVDSDGDGYPDKWNKGKTVSNSTTGLTLDVFPRDSACNNTSQGVNGLCDYNAAVPNFTPEKIESDAKYIYLTSLANARVYRWNIAKSTFENPIILSDAPSISTTLISSAHNRLYSANTSGLISSIDLTSLKSVNLVKTNGDVFVTIVGDYFKVGYSIFDKQGNYTGRAAYSRSASAWDGSRSRLYTYDYGYLNYEGIDQQTGVVNSQGVGAYSVPYSSQPIVRLSPDNKKILLNSGEVFDPNGFSRLTSLGGFFDAAWAKDGGLAFIKANQGNTQLNRISTEWKPEEYKTFEGSPLGIVAIGSNYIVVTQKNSRPTFYTYVPKNDTDNDGVSNTVDAFPEDAAASVDSDNDGYPDAWNTGKSAADSTSALTLDVFPQDSACHNTDDGLNGICNYNAMVPNFIPDQTVSDSQYIYLLSKANKRIYRWSIMGGSYDNPIIIGRGPELANNINNIAVSNAHDRIYVGYSTGTLNAIERSTLKEHEFGRTPQGVYGLLAIGNYVFVQVNNNGWSWAEHYIFDQNGTITQQNGWGANSRVYTWDPVKNRVYFFRDGISPNDLLYEEIDPATGTITAQSETPYHGDFNIIPPIRVSITGNKILLGSGDLYESTGLTWQGSVGVLQDATWLADDALVLLRNVDDKTRVERLNSERETIQTQNYEGSPLTIVNESGKLVVVTLLNAKPEFHEFVATDDSDSDGVNNREDAFPNDPAASLDTDNDGYPDSWNAGKSDADSTTSLVLDAFPQDSACYNNAQGQNGVCDYTAAVPNFVPDEIVNDSNFVYLLSKTNKRIYRWSITQARYDNPIILERGNERASDITKIAVSEAHNRIYIGYNSGLITAVSRLDWKERYFTRTAMAVRGLAAVGNYLLAQDPSGAWSTHYIFDEVGRLTDQRDWNYYSRVYTWDSINSRVYFFRDDTSPDDLHFEIINQNTGKISGAGETPYHGSYAIVPPIRVSVDGSQVLLGSGDIYETSGLTQTRSLGGLVDAQWIKDALCIYLTSGQLEVRSLDNLSAVAYSVPIDGTPRQLIKALDKVIVVSDINGATQLTAVAVGDEDEDGIPAYWEAQYGFSDSDSNDSLLDTDADGVSNRAEYENRTNPLVGDTDGDGLSDGDEISNYHTSPTKSDTDKDGLTDLQELTTYSTSPLLADIDDDGYSDYEEIIIYTTSPTDANSKPAQITSFEEGFEAGLNSFWWQPVAGNNADWIEDTSQFHSGSKSIRSGDIGDNQRSAVMMRGNFSAGSLNYFARGENEGCCDRLEVRVDGALVLSTYYAWAWTQYTINLSAGIHEIEWRYIKDGSVSTGADAFWLDAVSFTAN